MAEVQEPDWRPVTALRLIAALHVLVLHESLDPPLGGVGRISNILLDRTAALDLFFLVGGMLLTFVYWRVDVPGGQRRFWVSRFARIYPLYLVGLLLFLPLFLGRVHFEHHDWWGGLRAVVVNVFALQSWWPATAEPWYINRPGWTVSTLAFYYVTFPLVVRVLHRMSVRQVAAAFGLLFVASQVLVWVFENRIGIEGRDLEVLHKHPFVRWPEFLMGQCLGHLYIHKVHGRAFWKRPWLFPATGVVALGLFVFLPKSFDNYIHNGLLAPLFAVILFASLWAAPAWTAWMTARPMQVLGTASFTLYIIHLPVANYLSGPFYLLFGDTIRFTPWFLALDLAVVLPLSVWIHRRIEQPWRDRIKARLQAPTPGR